uniref:V-type proton ATPase subunit a n=1 Tax=Paramecium tetraurelia TaxID=5888 RepID=Q3SDC2_PARTE|nr:V-ATPase a subunit 7_2 isotype of the V0 sector [Paramecium tetraurelia]
MFRPTEIHLYKLYVEREQAFHFLTKVGQMNNVNLVNCSNHAFHEHDYYKQLKRCDDIYNKISEVKNLLILYNKPIHYCPNIKSFIQYLQITEDQVIKIEQELTHKVQFIMNQQTNLQQIVEQRNRLEEEIAVIQHCKEFIYKFSGVQLGYIVGCMNAADQHKFNRIVFRISKENGIVKFKDFNNEKIIFTLVFTKGKHENLKTKLLKICEAFNVSIFQLPEEIQIETKINELENELTNLSIVITSTKLEIEEQLDFFSDISAERPLELDEIYFIGYCSYICELKIIVDLVSATYYHLTFFEAKSQFLIGQMWCEPNQIELIKQIGVQIEIMQDINEKLYEPPSLLKTNQFTYIFQELVNTYGIPRYHEINPGLFTIITFPFLFGMMFGDIGHGIVLTFFGFYLLMFGKGVIKSIKLENSSEYLSYADFQSLYECRYLITLMGMFATYCGFIYNDFFSISLEYKLEKFQLGFDGKWSMSESHLTVMNSFKMKTAIIVGVIQMVFGILLKGWNCLNQRKFIDFIFNFIPELAFMLSTFGYMSFLIILKWLTNYSNNMEPPSIITTLLNMVFTQGGITGAEMYPHQVYFQTILIRIAICSPIIMLLKPEVIRIKRSLFNSGNQQMVYDDLVELEHAQVEVIKEEKNQMFGNLVGSRAIKEEKHFDFAEIYIESLIECIEFVLGAVSNTASYLRLWALSLAHSQLSEVFFKMSLEPQLESGSVIGICLTFMVYALATFGVLMCMDTLECFLHSLRLHWVEFQSKFYKGDGHNFQQFNYLHFLEQKFQFSTRM